MIHELDIGIFLKQHDGATILLHNDQPHASRKNVGV